MVRRDTDLRRGWRGGDGRSEHGGREGSEPGERGTQAGGALPGVGTCPACGHHTSACVAGCCTVFVPLPPESGRLAGYCGCDCLRAMTGESWLDGFVRATRNGRGSQGAEPEGGEPDEGSGTGS